MYSEKYDLNWVGLIIIIIIMHIIWAAKNVF